MTIYNDDHDKNTIEYMCIGNNVQSSEVYGMLVSIYIFLSSHSNTQTFYIPHPNPQNKTFSNAVHQKH